MSELQIIDCFSDFLAYWERVQYKTLGEQLDAWANGHMREWPELWQKQLDCYAEDEMNWREAAREHVVPFLSQQLAEMKIGHDNLLTVCEDIYVRGQQTIGFEKDLVCIIYVGIGCGAGWATTYTDKPAILFGLENIAAEGWHERQALTGLAAHELGHLAHFSWREEANLADEAGPWWQLYTEGVAQWCERLIMGRASWHMQARRDREWQAWCENNIGWLAAEFLRRMEAGEDVRPFFGSWYELKGYKQTGYFLGHEIVKELASQMSLQEIALLENVPTYLRPILMRLQVERS